MHRMTRDIATADVQAPFGGEVFTFKADRLRMERVAGERFMTLEAGADHRVYRVTRVIGGRYREDFAGIEVVQAAPHATVIGDPRTELVLPASYVLQSASYRPKGYSVMSTERPGLRAGPVWNQTCIDCHNTVPYLSEALGAIYGRGAPSFQGELVDPLLPSERRWSFEVTAATELERALRGEIQFLGGSAREGTSTSQLLRASIEATRDRLDAAHLVEVGIGCESCHGGSREHVANPSAVVPSYEPRSPFLYARPPDGAEAARGALINRTCARCHQVLFSRYAYTWEGGSRSGRAHPPGGSSINSGEARDLLLSRCQIACTACHDPHREDAPARLAALATPTGNSVCTTCHPALGTPAALRAHAHHDPSHKGASCVGCHMPRKNMGLGYTLTRYHRIGSPNDTERVERDRPIECVLCHTDKTGEALVAQMERWWGRRFDRTALHTLYGDLKGPLLLQTLRRGKPHEQAVAIALLGEKGDLTALEPLASALTHPYPLLRPYAKAALEQMTHAPLPIALDRDNETIRSATQRWLLSEERGE
jgi:predicted CXXCH cytochrome family protein